MNLRSATVPMSLAAALFALVVPAHAGTVDEGRAALEGAISAFNARDYAAYQTFVADDIEVFTGVVTPLRYVGKTKWLAFIRGLDAFASANYEQRHAECRAYGDDVVACNGYFVFTTVSKDGVTEIQTGRESSMMVKMRGKWLIANHHFSPIF